MLAVKLAEISGEYAHAHKYEGRSIHPGQNEAAHALGLGRGTTFGHVVLPQALRLALPGTNTMFVDLIKSTSLLVTISAAEADDRGAVVRL